MKIVVFGPERRTGALHDGQVVDLCGAFAHDANAKMSRRNMGGVKATPVILDMKLNAIVIIP